MVVRFCRWARALLGFLSRSCPLLRGSNLVNPLNHFFRVLVYHVWTEFLGRGGKESTVGTFDFWIKMKLGRQATRRIVPVSTYGFPWLIEVQCEEFARYHAPILCIRCSLLIEYASCVVNVERILFVRFQPS